MFGGPRIGRDGVPEITGFAGIVTGDVIGRSGRATGYGRWCAWSRVRGWRGVRLGVAITSARTSGHTLIVRLARAIRGFRRHASPAFLTLPPDTTLRCRVAIVRRLNTHGASTALGDGSLPEPHHGSTDEVPGDEGPGAARTEGMSRATERRFTVTRDPTPPHAELHNACQTRAGRMPRSARPPWRASPGHRLTVHPRPHRRPRAGSAPAYLRARPRPVARTGGESTKRRLQHPVASVRSSGGRRQDQSWRSGRVGRTRCRWTARAACRDGARRAKAPVRLPSGAGILKRAAATSAPMIIKSAKA